MFMLMAFENNVNLTDSVTATIIITAYISFFNENS